MKPDIYAQHDAAFKRVSAFVVIHNGARVATIAFKFPADGAGRLYAYVHWLGAQMVRGHANGYGYDKRPAAVANAVNRIAKRKPTDGAEALPAFIAALSVDDGRYWNRRLEDAGFIVWQAV